MFVEGAAVSGLVISRAKSSLRCVRFHIVPQDSKPARCKSGRAYTGSTYAISFAKFSVRGDRVAVSVSGQNGLARFIKLPPVESKKIPNIVRYEARQQIPFDLGRRCVGLSADGRRRRRRGLCARDRNRLVCHEARAGLSARLSLLPRPVSTLISCN